MAGGVPAGQLWEAFQLGTRARVIQAQSVSVEAPSEQREALAKRLAATLGGIYSAHPGLSSAPPETWHCRAFVNGNNRALCTVPPTSAEVSERLSGPASALLTRMQQNRVKVAPSMALRV